jgi:hypothetical protein
MKTTIVTRFWYKDKISDLKIELLQKYFIDGLSKQTDKDFDIDILVHKNTVNQLHFLDWKGLRVNFTKTEKNTLKLHNDILSKYNCGSEIQIRLDADDFVTENFIKTFKKNIDLKNAKQIVTFQPSKLIHATGEKYTHQKEYSERMPSMFLALYQQSPKLSIYQTGHDQFYSLVKNSKIITDETICYLVIHTENIFSKA